jgi:RNA polymerase sigma factor (sigma-70 family)
LRKKRSTVRLVRDDISELADGGKTPQQNAEAQEQRQRVLSVLRGMPEEYRIPLMLRYLGGADYDTIARQLALSNGSLRGLLQRGMKMLREQVRE